MHHCECSFLNEGMLWQVTKKRKHFAQPWLGNDFMFWTNWIKIDSHRNVPCFYRKYGFINSFYDNFAMQFFLSCSLQINQQFFHELQAATFYNTFAYYSSTKRTYQICLFPKISNPWDYLHTNRQLSVFSKAQKFWEPATGDSINSVSVGVVRASHHSFSAGNSGERGCDRNEPRKNVRMVQLHRPSPAELQRSMQDVNNMRRGKWRNYISWLKPK